MFKSTLQTMCLFCVLSAPTLAETRQAVKSGLQPGETAAAFHVQDVTGPRKGNSLCYACAFGKHSVVNIQTQKLTDELVRLVKQLDGMVSSAGQIRGDSKHAFVVYLTEDPDEAEKELEAIATKHQLKNIPLTIYDELSGPKPYKLSKEAEVTVMMWKDTKVTHNHAFAPGRLDAAGVERVLRNAEQHLRPQK